MCRDLLVGFLRALIGQVVDDGVLVVEHVVLELFIFPDVLEVEVLRRQAVHVELQVVDGTQRSDVEDVHDVADDAADLAHRHTDLAFHRAHAVVGRCKGRDGMDPAVMAAGEERREVVGVRDRAFFFAAVRHEFRQHASGDTAEGMTDYVDLDEVAVLIFRAPLGKQSVVIGAAVAIHPVLFRMRFAVVHGAAEELRVDLTGAVPRRRERAHRRRHAGHAHVDEHLADVRGPEAEVRQEIVRDLLLTEAEHAVEQDDGVLVLVSHFQFPPLGFFQTYTPLLLYMVRNR